MVFLWPQSEARPLLALLKLERIKSIKVLFLGNVTEAFNEKKSTRAREAKEGHARLLRPKPESAVKAFLPNQPCTAKSAGQGRLCTLISKAKILKKLGPPKFFKYPYRGRWNKVLDLLRFSQLMRPPSVCINTFCATLGAIDSVAAAPAAQVCDARGRDLLTAARRGT